MVPVGSRISRSSVLLGLLRPSPYLNAVGSILRALVRHRRLVGEMTRRELTEQHAGQVLGGVWAITHPLFIIGVYLFVFGVVFAARVGGTREMPLDYSTYILAGLIPWLAIQQSATRACASIVSHDSLVKQVVFPIEILPATTLLGAAVTQGVGLAALVVYVLVTHGSLQPSYLLLPVALAIEMTMMLGVCLALAAISVFVRDVREVVTMLASIGVFVLPIVYLPEWVPASFKPLIVANPLSPLIWVFQDVLYFGRIEHAWAWPVSLAVSLVCLALGARVFQWSRHMFGDAL